MLGDGVSHPQHQPLEMPSLEDQGSIFVAGEGYQSASAPGEAPQGGGLWGLVGSGRGP